MPETPKSSKIIEQEINIQRKQDNVKKERSSYGVVKIGQFSKMDYDISKTIAKNFKEIIDGVLIHPSI